MPERALTAITTTPTPAPTITPTQSPDDAGGGGAGIWILIVLAAALYTATYFADIKRHPFKRCRSCQGGGKKHSNWFNNGFRACDRCGGTGREYRRGASDPYKQHRDKRRRQG